MLRRGTPYEGVRFKNRSYGSSEIRKFNLQEWMQKPLDMSECKCGRKYLTKLGCLYCQV